MGLNPPAARPPALPTRLLQFGSFYAGHAPSTRLAAFQRHRSIRQPRRLATIEAMRKSLAAGALISLAGFALVFWAVGRFLSVLPLLEASRWFQPVTNGITLLAVATGPLIYLRKRRRKIKPAHR